MNASPNLQKTSAIFFATFAAVTAASAIVLFTGLPEEFWNRLRAAIYLLAYLTAPLCWAAPDSLRRAHLAGWTVILSVDLPFQLMTYWGWGNPVPPPVLAWKLFLIYTDLLVLTTDVLAVRETGVRDYWSKFTAVPLLATACSLGVLMPLLVWSNAIPDRISSRPSAIAAGRPLCLAANRKKTTNLKQLTGIVLLSHRWYFGDGAALSLPLQKLEYAVLSIRAGTVIEFWEWSFTRGDFVQLKDLMYSCDPPA